MSSTAKKCDFMNNILDDIYHPEKPICQIIPTCTRPHKEDLFKKYRPPKGDDEYNISQTEIKLDAGSTKILVQQTEAEYAKPLDLTAPPPPQKKPKYFSGGPPQWEFLEEIYIRKMEKKQERYRKEFAERVALRKKTEKIEVLKNHRRLLSLSGPEWYQELSPRQIKVIDNLQDCILKDFSCGVISHSQDNIAQLGLVLRPNHKHIEKALKHCCKCPVEFLLILYQLINPKRKKYSINDRLLLSAVVHLTMKDTLKELHVRIPSPPPPPKVTKRTPKKKTLVKHASPYLQPFAMERDVPKYSGVYYNKHLQHPQSPYFAYLEELNNRYTNEVKSLSKKSRDEEIDNETELAQSMYEQLVDYRPVRKLLKPSRYKQCYNFRNKFHLPCFLSSKVPLSLDDEVITCVCNKTKKIRRQLKKKMALHKEDILVVGGVVEKSEGPVFVVTGLQPKIVPEVCTCPQEFEYLQQRKDFVSSASKNQEKFIVGGVVKTAEGPLLVVSGVQPEHPTEAELARKREEFVNSMIEEKRKFVIGGVVNRHDGPVFIISGVQPGAEIGEKVSVSSPTEKLVNSMIEQKRKFVIGGVVNRPDGPVFFISGVQAGAKIEEEVSVSTPTEKLVNSMIKRKTKFVIGGVVNKPDGPVFVISGVQPSRKCCPSACYVSEESEEESEESMQICYSTVSKRICCLPVSNKRVTEETNKVSKPFRYTERRMIKEEEPPHEDFENDDKTNKSDSKTELCDCKTESRKIIDKPLCNCERCQADRRNKTTTLVIHGMKEIKSEEVVPVIDAVISEQPCKCLENYGKKIKDYENYQQRKQLVYPKTGKKDPFVVGGIVNTPNGPVFVHDGIQPKLDCGCAETARKEEAMKQHLKMMPHAPLGRIKYGIRGVKETPEGNVYLIDNTLPSDDCPCMDIFNQFSEAHGTCLDLYEAYLAKMKTDINEFIAEMRRPTLAGGEFLEHLYPTKKTSTNEEEEDADEKEEEKEEPEKVEKNRESCSPEDTKSEQKKTCDCGRRILVPPEKEKCEECTCGVILNEEEEEEESSSEEEEESESHDLKRFFIHKKFLCGRKWQTDVLKKALKSMADDGYPLAKLPHCDRLPHFKLWMQMRCGKTWTQEEKHKSVLLSKFWWRHVDSCPVRPIKNPKLAITRQEGASLDWSRAPYVRKIVTGTKTDFYRRVRQVAVEIGREFFPTTLETTFPFHTFRDCFFSYSASKEEDVLARFTWQKHEYNNMADRHCPC